jgi:hypothetical protein
LPVSRGPVTPARASGLPTNRCHESYRPGESAAEEGSGEGVDHLGLRAHRCACAFDFNHLLDKSCGYTPLLVNRWQWDAAISKNPESHSRSRSAPDPVGHLFEELW